MSRTRQPISCVLAGALMLLASMGVASGDEGPGVVSPARHCGIEAAYTLLRLEGRPAGPSWSRLADSLPEAPRLGYSMEELRDAISGCGLGVAGVRLRTDRQPLDRPALVFLQRGDHGHFVVIRPVGHTGRLVQILDPSGEPAVVDAVDLYASPQWTGLALIPRRPALAARVVAVSTALIALLPSLPAIRRRWSNAHRRLADGRPAR